MPSDLFDDEKKTVSIAVQPRAILEPSGITADPFDHRNQIRTAPDRPDWPIYRDMINRVRSGWKCPIGGGDAFHPISDGAVERARTGADFVSDRRLGIIRKR